MRKVKVVPHNEEWAVMFEEEAARIKHVFRSTMIEIHHIGSTSVKGLKAKPIIDIMPVVKNIECVDFFNEKMIHLGYEPKGENGIANRRFFEKGGDDRTHHVHIFERGNNDISRHLAFRDYLRSHSDVAKKYGNLKEELAKQYPLDVKSYINAKAQLITEIEKHALDCYGVSE